VQSDSKTTTGKQRLQTFYEFSERLLRAAESWTVVVLVSVIWIVAVGTAIWMAIWPTVRLPLIMKNINDNWRACLLLLVPLFYQTTKGILQRIKKFPLGMEAQEAEDERIQPSKKEFAKNPPETEVDE
jgi:hypothetical protein